MKKKKVNLVEAEVERELLELKEHDADSEEAERIVGNISKLREAEERKTGKKVKLDPNKLIETVAGTLIPTLICVHAEEIKNVIIRTKAFSKIKFK